MSSELPTNPDLAWDLGETIDRDRAIEFVMQFETTLCVYSPSVEQLYSTYHIFFPEHSGRRMVILPDPAAFHDTFHGLHPSAVDDTGVYIVPGELIGKSGLYLANVSADRRLGKRQIPFESGCKAILRSRPKNDPFLPVLVKGDLREFGEAWPVLHLHRVKLPVLAEISELDRVNIHNVIMEKLDALFLTQRKRTESGPP